VLIWKHTEQNVPGIFKRTPAIAWRDCWTPRQTLAMIVILWMKKQTRELLTFIPEKI
jgi:hypothetical protein